MPLQVLLERLEAQFKYFEGKFKKIVFLLLNCKDIEYFVDQNKLQKSLGENYLIVTFSFLEKQDSSNLSKRLNLSP